MAVGPRIIAQEDILLTVDDWLYHADEDEDGKISSAEVGTLNDFIRSTSPSSQESASSQDNVLTSKALMGMADSDGDGFADRTELIDMLQRMKQFDAGRLSREEASTPGLSAKGGVAHAKKKRTEGSPKKSRKRKRQNGPAAMKDEM
eukprot:CAMPEP_0119375544 /NCGR_PEP_ID=MMETSP1334-20130426/36466_1 /TAXON_ID=127549 /ORGANISM="Calcidiscus leptoporus, Strain RCC1130" /LENGTH=146 /DNA_ID=CAMNT_0007393893 /DNA_START=205 /DNA_END=645 /DNA_ORIENTATION=-